MAFVMAIQLYYNNKTQEDILTELNRLKQSINSTTDRILVERFEPATVSVFSDSMQWSSDDHFKNDLQVEDNQVILNNTARVWNFKTSVRSDSDKKQDNPVVVFESANDQRFSQLGKKLNKLPIDLPPAKLRKILNDSASNSFNIVEYNLNSAPEDKDVNVFLKSKEKIKHDDVLSFEFPNLMFSDEPQKVRFNYSTAEFNNTLEDIRNRNLLLTLGLFGLSIILIATVTGKFLKPIKSLNQSFDKVVQGDLDVVVQPKYRDEIGELSASFNHMVNELRKNKDREELSHRQERLASLGQLAAGVAHEIKNPLNAINLTIEHLNDKFINARETQAVAYVHTIQNEIRRLDKTVNNLLSYLRSENLSKNDTDVNLLLEEIFHLYEREIKAHSIKLVTNYSKSCIINLDAERFKTVLMNVVTNAIQSMEQGGTLKVTTDQQEKLISIEDTGPGIPKKNLEHIFDLFYTTKSAGTGLGLPTAYKIMQEHGGSIQIRSEQVQGTKVLISFNE
jgi:signal transduction histidine kinase